MGNAAVVIRLLTRQQRHADQLPHMLLVGGLGGEQHPKPYRVVVRTGRLGVMRPQRARRFVVPMSAQLNGYPAAGRA